MIEKSIRSVFRSSYDIVIVDSYSTDGTWEKLQELKKEYNLTLYRLKSTRGKGRDYALRRCPENSMTAYFDLDTIYNENFHKVIDLELPFVNAGTYVAKKEYLIEVGGWRDLNWGEDIELLSRVRVDLFLPIIVGYNEKVNFDREKRYARNHLKYQIRKLRNTVDDIRGLGFNLNEYLKTHYYGLKYLPIQSIIYLIAKVKGIYRNCKTIPNHACVLSKFLEALKDPEEYGFPAEDILLTIDMNFLHLIKRDKNIELPFPITEVYGNFILNMKTKTAITKHLENLAL